MNSLYSSEKYKRAKERAEEMLSRMTLTEKIGQLSQFGTSIYSDNEKPTRTTLQRARWARILP